MLVKKKAFETSFKKLYLITADVYDRILASLPKPELEEIKRMNKNPVDSVSQESNEIVEEKVQPAQQIKNEELKALLPINNVEIDSVKEEPKQQEEIHSSNNGEILSKLQKIQSDLENIKGSSNDEQTKLTSIHEDSESNKNSSKDKKSATFICEICGKKFSSKFSKNRHILSVHERLKPQKPVKKSENSSFSSVPQQNKRKRKIEDEHSYVSKMSKLGGLKRKKDLEIESPAKKNKEDKFEMWS